MDLNNPLRKSRRSRIEEANVGKENISSPHASTSSNEDRRPDCSPPVRPIPKVFGQVQISRVSIGGVPQRLQDFSLTWTVPNLKLFKEPIHFKPIRSPPFGGWDLEIQQDIKFTLILLEQTEWFSFCIDSSKMTNPFLPKIGPLSGTCRILDRNGKVFMSHDILPGFQKSADWSGCQDMISRQTLFAKDFFHRYEIFTSEKELVIEADIVLPDSKFSCDCLIPNAERALKRISAEKERLQKVHNFNLISPEGITFGVNHQQLVIASKYFSRNFKELSRTAERNSLKMADVSFEVLEIMVEYLRGDLEAVSPDLMPRLLASPRQTELALQILKAACTYELSVLRDACESYMKNVRVTVENSADLLILAHQNGWADKVLSVSAFIRDNLEKVSQVGGAKKIIAYNSDIFCKFILSPPCSPKATLV